MTACSRRATRSAGSRRWAACSAIGMRRRRPRSARSPYPPSSSCAPIDGCDVEAIAALRVPAEVEAEVEAHLRRYVRFILEREARALAFVDEVRGRTERG